MKHFIFFLSFLISNVLSDQPYEPVGWYIKSVSLIKSTSDKVLLDRRKNSKQKCNLYNVYKKKRVKQVKCNSQEWTGYYGGDSDPSRTETLLMEPYNTSH